MTQIGPEPSPSPAAAPSPTPAPGVETTSLDPRWVRKMVIMIIASGGFSLWGLYDAMVAYPDRGRTVARYDLRELIRVAEQDRRLDQVSTPEPTKEYERLSVGKPVNAFDQAKLQWLESLHRVGELDPTHTTIDDPTALRDSLDAEFAKNPGQTKPSSLSAWDIPVQWGIFGVCGLIALYLVGLFLKVKGTRFTWNAVERKLGLPGGASIVPSDLADIDKRKWHKFFVTLGIRPEHPTLGGKSVTLDLYRHARLEGWILEMEEASGLTPQERAAEGA